MGGSVEHGRWRRNRRGPAVPAGRPARPLRRETDLPAPVCVVAAPELSRPRPPGFGPGGGFFSLRDGPPGSGVRHHGAGVLSPPAGWIRPGGGAFSLVARTSRATPRPRHGHEDAGGGEPTVLPRNPPTPVGHRPDHARDGREYGATGSGHSWERRARAHAPATEARLTPLPIEPGQGGTMGSRSERCEGPRVAGALFLLIPAGCSPTPG